MEKKCIFNLMNGNFNYIFYILYFLILINKLLILRLLIIYGVYNFKLYINFRKLHKNLGNPRNLNRLTKFPKSLRSQKLGFKASKPLIFGTVKYIDSIFYLTNKVRGLCVGGDLEILFFGSF